MEDLSITINIAGRQYRLRIKKEEESTFKEASELINKIMKEYAQHYAYKDNQDLLAMVALQQTTSYLKEKAVKDQEDEGLNEKLEKINRMLSDRLDD